MMQKPDLDVHVFCRVRDTVMDFRVSDDDEPMTLDAGAPQGHAAGVSRISSTCAFVLIRNRPRLGGDRDLYWGSGFRGENKSLCT